MIKRSVSRRLGQIALFGLVILVVAASAAELVKRQLSRPVVALVISGTPRTGVVAGQSYEFTPRASGPAGHALIFSIIDKPGWARFNARTGQLTGTPTSANGGTYSKIVIRVSDGLASAALRPFSITVTNAPTTTLTIAGQPGTSVNSQWAYSFTPTVSNANGARLTFSIQNRPSWAAFNSASGQLSGTPAAADVGTYANIIISVANGVASASLAPFTIAVNQISNGSATLNWMPPTRNTNGSALTNLSGYRIYYGTAANSLGHTINVATIGVTSYTISNLSTGTWYFQMTAYTSGGVESALTSLVSKTIP